MKAILKFDLPEETEEFKVAAAAMELAAALFDIDNKARSVLKHGNGTAEEAIKALEDIRDLMPRHLL